MIDDADEAFLAVGPDPPPNVGPDLSISASGCVVSGAVAVALLGAFAAAVALLCEHDLIGGYILLGGVVAALLALIVLRLDVRR